MITYKKLSLLALSFVVTFFVSSLILSANTVPNPERPNLTLSTQLFNRAVWPRLGKTLPYLPTTIANTITPEQAEQFDSHNNYVFPFQVRALRDPTKGTTYLNTITVTAVKHLYPEIIGAFLFDFGKYLLPGLAFPLEAIGALPESAATSWTISRANMVSPTITTAYLWAGSLFFLAIIVSAIMLSKKIRLVQPHALSVVVIVVTYIVGNSALFALSFGMDAHIRYALPNYVISLNFLLVFVVFATLQPQTGACARSEYRERLIKLFFRG